MTENTILIEILNELKHIRDILQYMPEYYAAAHFLEQEKFDGLKTSHAKYSDTIDLNPPAQR